jgi:hypothetical protein
MPLEITLRFSIDGLGNSTYYPGMKDRHVGRLSRAVRTGQETRPT